LITVPISVIKNAIRIYVLSVLAINVDPRILTSRLHQEGGIPFFLIALSLLAPFVMLLSRSERRGNDAPTTNALRQASKPSDAPLSL
jgi:hypothetical protein